jgi:hypothetical protein
VTPAPSQHDPPSFASSEILDSNKTILPSAFAPPAQTPKPPGAWMPTPAMKKSIMKVRFDTTGDSGTNPGDTSKASSQDISVEMDISTVTTPRAVPRRQPPTPPLATPSSPSRSLSRKSGIRVLDAFGQEVSKETVDTAKLNTTPRNKSAIRVVDAMGRTIDTSEQELLDPSTTNEESNEVLNRDEALLRVRQGLADLAEGLENMEKYISPLPPSCLLYSTNRFQNQQGNSGRASTY